MVNGHIFIWPVAKKRNGISARLPNKVLMKSSGSCSSGVNCLNKQFKVTERFKVGQIVK